MTLPPLWLALEVLAVLLGLARTIWLGVSLVRLGGRLDAAFGRDGWRRVAGGVVLVPRPQIARSPQS